jgi:hypothetical protein
MRSLPPRLRGDADMALSEDIAVTPTISTSSINGPSRLLKKALATGIAV